MLVPHVLFSPTSNIYFTCVLGLFISDQSNEITLKLSLGEKATSRDEAN